MLPSRTVVGYIGGNDPWLSIVEVRWPNKSLSPPEYVCRGSRRGGYELLSTLVNDARFQRAAVVASTDEIDAQAIAETGFEVIWARTSTGPGAMADDQARSCLIIPVPEIETVLRRLITTNRLTLPETLKALSARTGGEIATEDCELLALGSACWYAFGRDDGVREQPKRRWLPRMKAEEDAWESSLWDQEELPLLEWVKKHPRDP